MLPSNIQDPTDLARTREGVLSPQALPASFYARSAREVARDLLGCWLVRREGEVWTGGVIVETEAYLEGDPSSHGFRGQTLRNRAMFGPPGRAYVYFIYGNHWCFNAVCREVGVAEAVLVRAIEPLFGLERMRRRRAGRSGVELTNGPGKFCQALAIDRSFDDVDLTAAASPIQVAVNPARRTFLRTVGPTATSGRVGIREAADWPLRFYLSNSPWVSGASRRRDEVRPKDGPPRGTIGRRRGKAGG